MAGPVEATTVLRSSIWRRAAFGVGGKLQSAFSIVAGLTAISTVVSLLCFSAVEAGLNDFADRQMPIVANVIQLSAISGEISAAAARLINARTPGDQKAIAVSIARKRGDLAAALQRLETLDSANPAVAALFTLSQRLNANLAALEDIIAERSDLRDQIVKLDDALHQTHTRLLDRLAQLPDSRAALKVSARAHLLVSLIGEASTLREPAEFKHIQELLKSASDGLASRPPRSPTTISTRSPPNFCRSASAPTVFSPVTRGRHSWQRAPTPRLTRTWLSSAFWTIRSPTW